ncbi:MAG: ATP-binding protein, partial [Pirellulales bacterium]
LISRGYSLGAVDYILAPIVPEVLRTKVSVFLDLGRKTREIERQAERLRHRAEQLHKLSQASLAIHSAMSLDKMLQVITDSARDIIGAHQATAITAWDENWARCKKTLSLSPQLESSCSQLAPANGLELRALWMQLGRASRLTPQELQSHPAWQLLGRPLWDSSEAPDWLAAPLTGRDGRDMGLLHVCGKYQGDFSAEDEAVLLQLAQMASIAIENTLNSEAREANRIKDEFLATLSHELRTPLTAMLGWTQLLRTGKLGNEEAARGLDVIERNVLAQAKLIDDLLDVSRIITGKLKLSVQRLSLAGVIEAAIDVVRPAANAKGIELVTSLDDRAAASGDPDRLQQVVWNLLVNAIKFSPPGGAVRVNLTRNESRSRIEVADSGEGIAPEFLPHIFDRFRQADSSTRRSHGGLGLGLAIVRHVVELHGGSIHAYSDGPDRGATFVVELPITAMLAEAHDVHPASLPPRQPALPAADASLAGVRVLIVDDEPDGRDTIAKMLTVYEAQVTTASSAREARTLFEQSPPDVLISDIGMPDEDGYDLIRCLRRLPPSEGGGVPAIALTAFAREEDRLQALAAGFQVHATKPIEPAELIAAVQRLAGRAPPEPGANGNGSHASHPLVATG